MATAGLCAALALAGCQTGTGNPPDTTPIPGGGKWLAFKKPPLPLHEPAAAVLNGKVYYVGGRLESGALNTLYEYDPATDEWKKLASFPGAGVDHMMAVVVDGLLYAIGGTLEWPGPSVTEMYAYDPVKNEWSQKASLPKPQGAMGAGVVDGKIYTMGGLSGGVAVNFVFEYDPEMNEWTDLTDICPMPTARDHFIAGTINGKIHGIGGRARDLFAFRNVHEVFDPATQEWSTAAPMPTARGGFIAAVLDGELLIMGGEGAMNDPGVFSQNEAYDPATNTWRTLSPMNSPRHATQAGVVGDVVFVAAGSPVIGRTYTSDHEGFSFGFE